MNSGLVIAPVLLPFAAGLVLLLLSAKPLPLQRRIGTVAGLLQIAAAAWLLQAVAGGETLVYRLGDWPAPWGIVLVADRLAAGMVLITALLAVCAQVYAYSGIDGKGRHFHVLFQLQLFGLCGAFLTGDLFNLFVFFEVLLIASYGLLLHGGGAPRIRAGLHYVVLNLIGSSAFLVAAGLFYGVFGTLNFADIAARATALPADDVGLARVAGLLLFGVFALKTALVPLYLWLPAAYGSASAPVAALFAIMTKVGAYAILRIHTLVFGDSGGALAGLLEPWLLPLALVTLALGIVGAIGARRLGAQTAYFVVASIGTLLTAFALNTPTSIAAGLYYLPHSTFAAAAMFILADAIARRRPTAADGLTTDISLAHAGLWGGLFFVTAVVIAGLPPFAGFIGKFLILRSAIDHPAWVWIFATILLAALFSVIALSRTGSVLFLKAQPDGPPSEAIDKPRSWELIPIAALIGLAIGLTFFAGPAVEFAIAAAEQLLRPELYIQAVLGSAQ